MSWRTLLLCSGLGILICSLPTSPLNGPRRLYGTANDRSCQVCHPGATNNLSKSVHRSFLVNPAIAEQACTVCHGDLTEHRASARREEGGIAPVPLVEAASCNACHLNQSWPISTGAHSQAPTSSISESMQLSRFPEQQSGFDWSGMWTLGYRFLSRTGSTNRYRTDLNLDAGLRLLEAEVEARGRGDQFADLVRLRLNGLEDPYTDARFDISKELSYEGSAWYSEREIIYDTTSDFHQVDRNSKRGTFDLSLDLSEDLQLFGSYGRVDRDSFWLVNRIGDPSLIPLTTVDDVRSPRRLKSDLAELGLNLTSGATAMSLAFDYLDESTRDRWAYMRPAQANPAFTETEDFTSDSTLRGPGGRASVSTHSGAWTFDFTGRYANLDRRTYGTGTMTGFSFDEFNSETVSSSKGDATTWILDGSATWEFSDQAALVLDLRWLDYEERMTINQNHTTNFPNLGIAFTNTTVLDNRTDQEKLTGSAQVDYSPQQGIDLSLGYGFSHEDLTVPDLEPTDADFISGEISDHGLLAGVQWRPDDHWTVRAYGEDFRQTGNQVHALAGDDAQRVTTSLAYQGPGYRLETFLRYRHAENDISDYKLDYKALGVNGNVHQEEGLDLFASYVYSDLNSRTLTNFYFDPDPNPVPTTVGFDGQTHTLTGGLLIEPSANMRWQVDLNYTTTTGSFDVTLLDWRADMGLTVWTGGELGVLYRNVDYRDQNRIDDYDANIIFVYWRQIIGAH